jgi:hypothetical protein
VPSPTAGFAAAAEVSGGVPELEEVNEKYLHSILILPSAQH